MSPTEGTGELDTELVSRRDITRDPRSRSRTDYLLQQAAMPSGRLPISSLSHVISGRPFWATLPAPVTKHSTYPLSCSKHHFNFRSFFSVHVATIRIIHKAHRQRQRCFFSNQVSGIKPKAQRSSQRACSLPWPRSKQTAFGMDAGRWVQRSDLDLRWHWVAPSHALLLLSLDVLLIGDLLLLLGGKGILRRHAVVSRHAGLLCWDLRVANIVWRIARLLSIHAVLAVGCGFGCIEACLSDVSKSASGRNWNAYLDEVLALGFRD